MPKKYLHDKWVLLLVSINIFLACLCIVLIAFRLGAGQGTTDYIIQYRANLGINAFKVGSITGILSFMVFVTAIAIVNIALSIKAYPIRRTLSLAILGLGVLLLVFATIVSNALLVLR